MKNIACIIARTNSSRLPKKVLRDVGGLSLIEYIIKKVKRARLVDEIYLCTSIDEDDEVLLEIAKKCEIKSFAGSRESVIDRMLDVAKISNSDNLIRITGDNIFTDEVYLDIMLEYHIEANVDYTRIERLPVGITPEVMKTEALRACHPLINKEESQYLMLYMFQPEIFKCQVLIPELNHQKPNMSLTVDTLLDFERTISIISKESKLLDLDDILIKCEKMGIQNTEYKSKEIIKFPANLTVNFKTYRTEMDLRIEKSLVKQLQKGTYMKTKKIQKNV